MRRSSSALIILLALMGVGLTTPAQRERPAPRSPQVENAVLDDLEQSERVRVIVNLVDADGSPPRDRATVDGFRSRHDSADIEDYIEDAVVMEVDVMALAAVLDDPHVLSIGHVVEFQPTMQDVIPLIGADDVWATQMAGHYIDGDGYSIAIVDTGIDFSHPDLAAKNIVGVVINCMDPEGDDPCFEDPAANDTSASGHGTKVAGCAAAAGDTINGVAVGADLIALKVLNGSDGASSVDIRRAIDWAIANRDRYNIRVISISLGDGVEHEEPCDEVPSFVTIANGISMAFDLGIAVTIGAGNGGFTEGINAPACISQAIAVSHSRKNDDPSSSACYDEQVRIFAPGVGVTTTCVAGDTNGDGYCTSTGSSIATPVATGSLILINDLLDRIGVVMNPDELETLLFETGAPINGLPIDRWSRVDVGSAVRHVLAQHFAPGDLDYDGDVDVDDLTALFLAWAPGGCGPCTADIDGDGDTDSNDLVELILNWNPAE